MTRCSIQIEARSITGTIQNNPGPRRPRNRPRGRMTSSSHWSATLREKSRYRAARLRATVTPAIVSSERPTRSITATAAIESVNTAIHTPIATGEMWAEAPTLTAAVPDLVRFNMRASMSVSFSRLGLPAIDGAFDRPAHLVRRKPEAGGRAQKFAGEGFQGRPTPLWRPVPRGGVHARSG